METYTREEVQAIVQPDPSWMNFDVPVVYRKETLLLRDALHSLHTVWDDIEDFERPTFMELARALKENKLSDFPPEKYEKIQSLDKKKYMDTEITIPCFLLSDLKKLLPAEYPSTMKAPYDAYIVEDGNHRLTALALRLLNEEDIGGVSVTVYKGQIG